MCACACVSECACADSGTAAARVRCEVCESTRVSNPPSQVSFSPVTLSAQRSYAARVVQLPHQTVYSGVSEVPRELIDTPLFRGTIFRAIHYATGRNGGQLRRRAHSGGIGDHLGNRLSNCLLLVPRDTQRILSGKAGKDTTSLLRQVASNVARPS